MRRFIAIGIVLLLAIAVVVERGIDTEPAINAKAASTIQASGQLANLGPVTLINHEYVATITASTCQTSVFLSFYDASFDSTAFGASGTINTFNVVSFGGVPHSAAGALVAGTVTVDGEFFGSCGSGGATVSGTIDGGGETHTYVLTINTI